MRSKKRLIFSTGIISIAACILFFIGVGKKEGEDKLTINDSLGVSIHEIEWGNTDFSKIKQFGMHTVRDAFVWDIIEKEKGVYNFTNNEKINYDNFIEKFKKNNLRPYIMLLYANKLYNDNRALDNDEIKKAYAKWAAESAKRYRNHNIIWEIYNEPNHENFWNPQTDSARHYFEVVQLTAPEIKKNDPSGIVVAPALASLNSESLQWLEETFKLGILEYIDAISVHPYRQNNPETVISNYEDLKNLIIKYTDKDVPIISGEWGYSDIANLDKSGRKGSDQLTQAKFITRMTLINHSLGIPSILYDWEDDGTDSEHIEHHFGLLNFEGKEPKLAGTAIKILSDTIGDYRFVERMDTDEDSDFIFKYTNGDYIAYAVWTTGDNHFINLKVDGAGKVVNMLGKQSSYNGKEITLSITDSPIYILID